jgi:hypothetical protein
MINRPRIKWSRTYGWWCVIFDARGEIDYAATKAIAPHVDNFNQINGSVLK